MRGIVQRLHRDERGDAVQFILIAAVVAIPLVIAMAFFGENIVKFLQDRVNPADEDVISYEDQL